LFSQFCSQRAGNKKTIPLFTELRSCVSTGTAGLFPASTRDAGVDSSLINPRQTPKPHRVWHPAGDDRFAPVGARILINGDYVGITPLLIDVAVDKFGRALRNIELRAVAPKPMITRGTRLFPAAGTDGDSSRIPRLVDFDLNVQSVYVIR
jgi:hypothetical protein